jgi:Rod binding domain-containing protein
MPSITPPDNRIFPLQRGEASGLPAPPTESEKIADVSRRFESILLGYLLKTMRNAAEVFADGEEQGAGAGMMSDMMDEYLVQNVASNGGFGLGDMIAAQLSRRTGEGGGGDAAGLPAGGRGRYYPLDASDFRQLAPAGAARADDPERYEPIIARAAERFDLDPALVRAVIAQESAGDTTAVSPRGAKGLMQLMDGTAAELGVRNPFDPEENIFGGCLYLRKQLDAWDGDLDSALAAYNAGPETVRRYGGVPPFPETREYVRRINAAVKENGK